MRYLVGFVFALAVVASPLSAGAQEGEPWRHPHDRRTHSQHDRRAHSQDAPEEPALEKEPTQSWLQRLHPEAFEAPDKKSDSGFDIKYAPAQPQPHRQEGRRKGISRGGKVAVGILLPVLALGVAVGVVAGFDASWE